MRDKKLVSRGAGESVYVIAATKALIILGKREIILRLRGLNWALADGLSLPTLLWYYYVFVYCQLIDS